MKTENMTQCQSCSMPIESGPYCQYCADESGHLQAFAERFERMTQWLAKKTPGISRAEAERRTVEFMATMPAWKDHPELAAKRRSLGKN